MVTRQQALMELQELELQVHLLQARQLERKQPVLLAPQALREQRQFLQQRPRHLAYGYVRQRQCRRWLKDRRPFELRGDAPVV